MIKSYLEEKHVPEFSKLVDQRITERRISNIIWGYYMDAERGILPTSDWKINKKILEGLAKNKNTG